MCVMFCAAAKEAEENPSLFCSGNHSWRHPNNARPPHLTFHNGLVDIPVNNFLTRSPFTLACRFFALFKSLYAVSSICCLLYPLSHLFSCLSLSPATSERINGRRGVREWGSRGVAKPKQTDRFGLLIESICLWIGTNERAIRLRTH